MIVGDVKAAIQLWKLEPAKATSQLATSAIVGQGIFWTLGYDQLGLFMNPKKQFGNGQAVASWLAPRIPLSTRSAWIIKGVEVLTDLSRGPAEAALMRRHGFTPDAVAWLVTQPLFSAVIETVEKIFGVFVHPERVVTQEQMELSLACIYGSLFRLIQTALLYSFGNVINRVLTKPIERFVRRYFSRR
jgi:hypothetical protein